MERSTQCLLRAHTCQSQRQACRGDLEGIDGNDDVLIIKITQHLWSASHAIGMCSFKQLCDVYEFLRLRLSDLLKVT